MRARRPGRDIQKVTLTTTHMELNADYLRRLLRLKPARWWNVYLTAEGDRIQVTSYNRRYRPPETTTKEGTSE